MLSVQIAAWSLAVFFWLTKTYQEKCPEHQLGPGSWVKRATIPLVNPGVQKLSDRPATPGRSMVRFAGKHLLQVIQKWGNMGNRINKHWTLLYPIVQLIQISFEYLWMRVHVKTDDVTSNHGNAAKKRTKELMNERTDLQDTCVCTYIYI